LKPDLSKELEQLLRETPSSIFSHSEKFSLAPSVTPGSETTDSPSGRKRTTVLHPLLKSGQLLSTGSSRGCRLRPSRREKAGTESGTYLGSSLTSRVKGTKLRLG
jgi:hypothetical protein